MSRRTTYKSQSECATPAPRFSFIRWIPLLCWMSTIFKGSTDTLSVPRTSRIIEPFFRWLFPGITPDALSLIHVGVRKGGHLVAYAIFAALLWMALGTLRRLTLEARVKYTLLFSILYAAIDEFHQSFYPARGPAVTDVMIDALGAIIGLSLILAVRKYRMERSASRFQTAA